MEKWKIMVKLTELKDEKSRWENDKRVNIEIAISASATQLILYGLDVGNYSKINESNFIDDELWIGDNAGWYKIVEFWGDAIIWHGKLYSRLHLKVIHGYYNSMCI